MFLTARKWAVSAVSFNQISYKLLRFFHGVTLQAAVEQNGRVVNKNPIRKDERRKLNEN